MLDISARINYNDSCRLNGPESILDLTGCIGGREKDV